MGVAEAENLLSMIFDIEFLLMPVLSHRNNQGSN